MEHTKEEMDTRLAQIFNLYYPLTITIAGRFLRSEDSKDAAQDAFVKLYRKYDIFKPDNEIKALLIRIVTTVSIDRLRRYKAEQRTFADLQTAEGLIETQRSNTPERMVMVQELYSRVIEDINNMRPEWSDVLCLHTIMQFSQAEAAEMMGIHVTAFRARLNRARNYLKEKYGDEIQLIR